MRTISALVNLAVFATLVVPGLSAAEEAPDIRVTKTWDALRRAPAIKLEDGTRLHLGVESKLVPQWSGTLVYCLVENAGGKPSGGKLDTDQVLGPLDCEITRIGAPRAAAQLARIQTGTIPTRATDRLYVRSAVVAKPGKFLVEIRRRGSDKVIASTTITGVKDAFHPWTPFGAPRREQNLGEDFDGYLATRPDGIALPAHGGISPLIWFGKERKIAPEEALPKLLPAEIDQGLKLRAETGDDGIVLNISSDEEMLVVRPDWHFLVRWWVNGKPFVPKPANPQADQNGHVKFGKAQRLHVEFYREHLGARRGDRIGLQLLYLPDGWNLIVEDGMETLATASQEPGNSLPRLSNKVEFAAP